MKIAPKERDALVEELRAIYKHCVATGLTPSENFIKLGKWLKGAGYEQDAEELYQAQEREHVEKWLEAVESNVENEGRGGTKYSPKDKEFIESVRSQFEERSQTDKPLSGKQLRYLKSLYDKS